LPAASAQALDQLRPLGAAALGGTQVIRIGTTAPVPSGYRTSTVAVAGGGAAAAAAVERLIAATQSQPRQVIVLAQEAAPALQMPAAGLGAESGSPILFVSDAALPAPTAAALASLHRPAIYLLGAPGVSAATLAALGRLGHVSKVLPAEAPSAGTGESADPVENAVAVSRFSDGSFGWGIREAGHGLVFLNSRRALDAPAAAPLSSHGDYGPLLLLADRAQLSPALLRYLSNIQPGYTPTIRPVRAVYNHGWLIGDGSAISALAQAEIDALLEVAPRTTAAEPSPPAPE
jgi:hypothetical protein